RAVLATIDADAFAEDPAHRKQFDERGRASAVVPSPMGELLYVREYIGKNHEFRKSHHAFHQLESVFRCSLPNPDGIGPGTEHDKKQIGVEWIPLKELPQRRFLPNVIKDFFSDTGFSPISNYLGDVN
ncbi:MAG: hypothetical protein ACPGES_13140, partial [Coraliomargarita sp.]